MQRLIEIEDTVRIRVSAEKGNVGQVCDCFGWWFFQEVW
jgi:hypothetical protein